MNRTAFLCALALFAASGLAPAQNAAEDVLKRPIAEAGLAGESAAASLKTTAVPRAIAVAPRDGAASAEPKAPGGTEITAMEATFDNRKHEAIFTRNVTVTDPEFSVTCDRLVAMLKHEGSPDNGVKPTEKSPAAAAKAGAKKKGGLERAIAEGNVVIKQSKVEADGTTSHSFGKGQKADYDADTGIIVLTGRPSVQQGFNTCVATSDGTVMTLNRDGRMHVEGPFRSIIADKADLEK